MSELAPGWIFPLKRRDGLIIQQNKLGSYEVLPQDGRAAIVACPCCDKLLSTVRSAQLIADAIYPLQEASP